MGISQALYIGVNGLNSFSQAMSVVSDNISNANTNSYKANSIFFGDLVAGSISTLSTDEEKAGTGAAVGAIFTDFAQGPFQSTTNWSHLAINGKGFFNVMRYEVDENNGELLNQDQTARYLYTRDGSFHQDRWGFLVNDQGYALVNTNGKPIRLEQVLSSTAYDPNYTSFTIDSNGQIWGKRVPGTLTSQTDADPVKVDRQRYEPDLTEAGTFISDPADPGMFRMASDDEYDTITGGTGGMTEPPLFQASTTNPPLFEQTSFGFPPVYEPTGKSHGPFVPYDDPTGPGGSYVETSPGSGTYRWTGLFEIDISHEDYDTLQLITDTDNTPSTTFQGQFVPNGGNTYGFISRPEDYNKFIPQLSRTIDGVTESVLGRFLVNPYDPGEFRTDSAGNLISIPNNPGDLDEGDAVIRISTFPNENGMVRQGGNLYARGQESKVPKDSRANQDQAGSILSFNLEGSNVDIAKEMVNMIVYQSSYNATSKTITTSSQMLDTAVNMVR